MATVELRRVVEGEREELRAAAERYWAGLMPHAPVVRDPVRRAAYFDERFRFGDPDCLLWWGVVGEVKVGFAVVELLGEGHDGPMASMGDFFIEAEWRRRGYGTGVVRAIVDELRGRGVVQVDLNVRRDNPGALAFWESVGFELSLYHLRRYLDEG